MYIVAILKNPSDLSRVRFAWDVAKESHFSPTTILMYRKQQAGHVVIPVTVASMIFPNCMLICDLSLIYGGLFPFPYRLLLDVAAAKCIELSRERFHGIKTCNSHLWWEIGLWISKYRTQLPWSSRESSMIKRNDFSGHQTSWSRTGVSVSDLGNAEILAWLRLTVIEESTEWLLLGIGEVPWRKVQKSILENGGLWNQEQSRNLCRQYCMPFFDVLRRCSTTVCILYDSHFHVFSINNHRCHCADSEIGRRCCWWCISSFWLVWNQQQAMRGWESMELADCFIHMVIMQNDWRIYDQW